jgi:hypothetical protein
MIIKKANTFMLIDIYKNRFFNITANNTDKLDLFFQLINKKVIFTIICLR